MTSEKVMLEAGPELDTLIAESVMGWRKGKGGAIITDSWEDPGYWYDSVNGGQMRPRHSDAFANIRAWSPSQDIAAAFRVLDTLTGKGIYLARLSNGWDGDKWHCRLANDEYSKSWDSPKVDSAAHAICLAALETIRPE